MDYEKQAQLQKEKYEERARRDPSVNEWTPYDELDPEDQASICQGCGHIVDPEMPFDDGDDILCGGDVCDERFVPFRTKTAE